MDARVRKRGIWIAVLALAVVGLCMLLALAGTLAMGWLGSGRAYVQPPAGEGSAAPLIPHYGPWGGAWGPGAGFLRLVLMAGGLFMGLLFFGLIGSILVGVVRRAWCGKPPEGWGGHWRPHAGQHKPPWRAQGSEPAYDEGDRAVPDSAGAASRPAE